MARKSRRSSSRKMKHTRKHKTHRRRTHRRRTHRRRGGAEGAPVNYHLSGSWPSRMSLGQGADYFKYHEGQHGGGLSYGQFPEAVLDPGLPAALRGPAHLGGIDKAIADVRGLCDPPNCPGTSAPAQTTGGGRRRNRSRRNKTHGGNRRNRSRRNRTYGGNRRNRNRRNNAAAAANVANAAAAAAVTNAVVASNAAAVAAVPNGRNRRSRRRSGGALGYAPFPSPGMLLSSPKAYAEAGLNPEWKTDVAFTDAKIRETQ